MVSICGFHAEARLAVEQLQLARKVYEVVVSRAIVDHVVHGGSAHPPSGIVCTSTVMPRKSDGAPVHVPATGMAWLGSRVTATRTSFRPPTSGFVGSNSTHPPPGR